MIFRIVRGSDSRCGHRSFSATCAGKVDCLSWGQFASENYRFTVLGRPYTEAAKGWPRLVELGTQFRVMAPFVIERLKEL